MVALKIWEVREIEDQKYTVQQPQDLFYVPKLTLFYEYDRRMYCPTKSSSMYFDSSNFFHAHTENKAYTSEYTTQYVFKAFVPSNFFFQNQFENQKRYRR